VVALVLSRHLVAGRVGAFKVELEDVLACKHPRFLRSILRSVPDTQGAEERASSPQIAMSSVSRVELNERDLAQLRLQPDAFDVITALLGTKEMALSDAELTRQEVRDYLQFGNAGEAHALIHNAKSRREIWRNEGESEYLTASG
jgi:hypothetical protein